MLEYKAKIAKVISKPAMFNKIIELFGLATKVLVEYASNETGEKSTKPDIVNWVKSVISRFFKLSTGWLLPSQRKVITCKFDPLIN